MREVIRDYTEYSELPVVETYFKWDTPEHAESYNDVTSPIQSSFVVINDDDQKYWVSVLIP